MERLKIQVKVLGKGNSQAVVFTPQGDLDMCTLRKFREAMKILIEGGVKAMIIDMEQIEHLDSTATSYLLDLKFNFARKMDFLGFAAPSVAINPLLRMVGADRLLSPFSSVYHAALAFCPALGSSYVSMGEQRRSDQPLRMASWISIPRMPEMAQAA